MMLFTEKASERTPKLLVEKAGMMLFTEMASAILLTEKASARTSKLLVEKATTPARREGERDVVHREGEREILFVEGERASSPRRRTRCCSSRRRVRERQNCSSRRRTFEDAGPRGAEVKCRRQRRHVSFHGCSEEEKTRCGPR
jgi:hypothetical protein